MNSQITTYPQTPERLTCITPTTAPYIPDIAAATQLAKIAEQMLDERPGESVLVAQIPYFWKGERRGSVWCEIYGVHFSDFHGKKMAYAEAIYGRDNFGDWNSDGYFTPTDTTRVYAASLRHVAIVCDGTITRYEIKPNLRLVSDVLVEDGPDMPEWCGDEGSVEYRLQQQELVQETEGG